MHVEAKKEKNLTQTPATISEQVIKKSQLLNQLDDKIFVHLQLFY